MSVMKNTSTAFLQSQTPPTPDVVDGAALAMFAEGSLLSPYLKLFDPSNAFPLWEFELELLFRCATPTVPRRSSSSTSEPTYQVHTCAQSRHNSRVKISSLFSKLGCCVKFSRKSIVMLVHASNWNLSDEGMTPRSSILAYLVPAKEEARSKDTQSP
jgi:hypothetical protein